MFRFLRIERPTTTTFRPHSIATSAACCMRWMLDANEATRILPRAEREDRAKRLADEALRARGPGALRVRRVAEQEVDAAVSDLGELADIGLEAVDRRVVELPVARVDDAAGGGLDDERDRVGDRVRDTDELDAERAELERGSPGSAVDELRLSARARARRASTSRARA